MTSAAAELIGALLGTLFVALGLGAVIASALRHERRDRALLWFGTATAIYGARLIVRSETVRAAFSFSDAPWLRVEHLLTYGILVPGALLAESVLPTAHRRVLQLISRANIAFAIASIVWDVWAGESGAALPLNRAAVVVNLAAIVMLVAIDARSRRPTADAWIVLMGVAVFTATAMYETIHGGVFEPIDLEPGSMLVLVGCIGYVVTKRVLQSERRMAAVDRELETARRIQQSILPKNVPPVAGLSVATHYASMSEVAGDIYDFVVTPSGQLGILVADVSGHGVPAAIVASMVKIALAVQEDAVSDPGEVLTRINRALCGRFELAYVTAVFAIVNPEARTLTYASAGHPPPLLVRTSDGSVKPLDERGIVLGFLPDVVYDSTVVRDLAAGDRIALYSDGITEAVRSDGEFYGDRRFHEILARGVSQPPGAFTDAMIADARRWVSGPFTDDVTVVIVDLEAS